MNVALRKPMTLTEFLDWEHRQELRYEFDGFAPVAMAGGTIAHATLQRNLAVSIAGRLRGKPCNFLGSDLKVQVAGSIRYSDGFVVCTPQDPRATVVHDPVIVFEVLSPSTARTDRIVKAREYEATPSIQRYVMLEQDFVGATVFARAALAWSAHTLTEEDTLLLPEIDAAIPLAELYDGLSFGDSS